VITEQREATAAGPAADAPTDGELLARFAGGGDRAAFAEIVRRHGPLVLGVCRRVLGHRPDADDAFQATFLILARKAERIDRPERLGNWLYGVATRVAFKARSTAARWRARESRVEPMAPAPDPLLGLAMRELQLALDEELNRLPERHRVPLVLCYLEGKTHEEAADELGCPTGSMSWRLGRAREALRRRLVRRGLTLSVGLVFLLGCAGRAAASPLASADAARALLDTAPVSVLALADAALKGKGRSLGCGAALAALLAALLLTGSAAWAWQAWSSPAASSGCHSAPASQAK
jgi:RNA polymerase sigma factor (sigma-70 family)